MCDSFVGFGFDNSFFDFGVSFDGGLVGLHVGFGDFGFCLAFSFHFVFWISFGDVSGCISVLLFGLGVSFGFLGVRFSDDFRHFFVSFGDVFGFSGFRFHDGFFSFHFSFGHSRGGSNWSRCLCVHRSSEQTSDQGSEYFIHGVSF